MKLNLMADSEIYASKAELYDRFSEAEDAEGKVFNLLLPEVGNKTVLDIGCGTGKYLALFAPHVTHITGVDIAPAQLAVARKKTGHHDNVAVIEGDAATVALPKERYDIIVSTWALGTIYDDAHRAAVITRAETLLMPGGKIFLVENDEGGEFEDIRGRLNDPLLRTQRYNQWLMEHGFTVFEQISTAFKFDSADEARSTFAAIWGEEAKSKVNSHIIMHKIAIFKK